MIDHFTNPPKGDVLTLDFETRNIELPKGGIFELQMTQEFLAIVRKHFELSDDAEIGEDHLRMFIYGACKTAIDKTGL